MAAEPARAEREPPGGIGPPLLQPEQAEDGPFRPSARTFALVAVVVAVLAAATVVVEWYYDGRFRARQRQVTVAEADAVRGRLEASIHRNVAFLHSLAARLRVRSKLGQPEFDDFAERIIKSGSAIKNISLIRDLVIVDAYPRGQGKDAIGLDFRTVPAQLADLERAIARRDVVLTRPIELVQGGQAVIGRMPVFLARADPTADELWGLISVVIDTRSLFRDAGLTQIGGTSHFALRSGEDRAPFFGPAQLAEREPLVADVVLPSTRWELLAVPKDGWGLPASDLWTLRLVCLLVTAAAAGLVFRWRTGEGRLRCQLIRAKDRAEAASRAKSDFLSAMSHEIRTPLNGVIATADLLAETDLTHDQEHLVGMIRVSGAVLLSLISDVLDFARMEAVQLRLADEEFDVERLVEDAVRVLAGSAQARSVEIGAVLAPDLPAAHRGDPARLRQVLLNLAGNAVKFTDEGFVVIECSRVGRDGEEMLRFEVRDTGIGIPADQRHRLFDVFTQVTGGAARGRGGTGLGLAISRSLVEVMGGEIGVESDVGVGSTFWFEVPLQPVAGSPEIETLPTAASGLRSLVVSDLPLARRILEHSLARSGAETTVREWKELDRSSWWEDVGGPDFGLVILDLDSVREPDAILDVLRSVDADGRPPVVLLTPAGADGSVVRSLQVPRIASITKPVLWSRLRQVIAGLLDPGFRAGPSADHGRREAGSTSAPQRVLVAEDNGINQEVVRRMLERLGHHVEVVDDGRAAVEAVASGSYDVILMDMQMPDFDGLEASRAIRGMAGPVARTPIIAVTANAFDRDRDRCRAAGMDHFLAKPIRATELAEALEDCIRMRAEHS